MTVIYGQIESLKRIKQTLESKGINRFKSVKEINDFNSNFDTEKQAIYNQVENEILEQVSGLKESRSQHLIRCERKTSEIEETFRLKAEKLEKRRDDLKSKNAEGIIAFWYRCVRWLLAIKHSRLKKAYQRAIQVHKQNAKSELASLDGKIKRLTINREKLIRDKSSPRINELNYTKRVIEAVNPLIAGAVGERLVERELSKLSDDNILINDFSVEFNPPVYNKKEDDRIFSIQIDHLLITGAGLFIIETKNWSKESLNRMDLRSPVEQIRRTSYALFTVMNSNSSMSPHLNAHPWGEKQIPIKSLIAMINHKPKVKFKYVQIKTLNELIGYISHFEHTFERSEIKRIADFLIDIKT